MVVRTQRDYRTVLLVMGKIAGLAGLGLGTAIIVFRTLLQRALFSRLSPTHSYRLFVIVAVLTWSIAIAGIGAWAVLARRQPQPTPSGGDIRSPKETTSYHATQLMVAGTVVDSTSNAGISGAVIFVNNENYAITEPTGNFRIVLRPEHSVAGERLVLNVTAPGFLPTNQWVTPPCEDLIVAIRKH